MATVPNTFKGKKKGKVILTQYRVLFLTANRSDPMRSFSMPFQLIRGSNVEQNLFSPNQVTGKIMAENGGGWEGTATFKLIFNSGGATEFMRLMALAANEAGANPPVFHRPSVMISTVTFAPVGRQTPQFVGYMPPPPPPPGFYYPSAPTPTIYSQYPPPPPPPPPPPSVYSGPTVPNNNGSVPSAPNLVPAPEQNGSHPPVYPGPIPQPPVYPGFPPPPTGYPGYGPPSPGHPGYGPPSPGHPGYGPPSPGHPGYGPPSPGHPGYGPPPPGYTNYGPPPENPGVPPYSQVGTGNPSRPRSVLQSASGLAGIIPGFITAKTGFTLPRL